MKKSITVILPVYNSSSYLKDCIESILAQTHGEFELIIINDGSTDSSSEIIKSFRDSRIKILTNSRNMGLVFSLNRAIQEASGIYIARMDSDDIMMQNRLKIQSTFLDSHPQIGIVGSSMYRFGDDSSQRISQTENNILKSELLFNNPFHHPTVMFRKSLLEEYHLQYEDQYYLAEDYALWIKMFFHTDFANIADALVLYRMHGNQETRKNKTAMHKSIAAAQQIILNKLQINYTQEESEIALKLYTQDYEYSLNFVKRVSAWLEKLEAANQSVGLFDKESFRKSVGKNWFLVCTSLSSKKIKTKNIYQSSVLANYYKPSFKTRIKFHFKNLFVKS